MNWCKKYLKKIGFFIEKDIEFVRPEKYAPSGDSDIISDMIKTHRDFLKNILEDEDRRLNTIENKAGQLIAQIGLVFSLLGLFIPIIIDKISVIHQGIKILLLLVLVFAFLFYLLTVKNAVKNFDVKKFIYSRPSPKNVIDFQSKPLNNFLIEEVNDLLTSNARNVHTNNKKAENLMFAYNSFRIANTLTGILVISICVIIMFFKNERNTISIDQPIKIENFDSSMRMLRKDFRNRKDTVIINLQQNRP